MVGRGRIREAGRQAAGVVPGAAMAAVMVWAAWTGPVLAQATDGSGGAGSRGDIPEQFHVATGSWDYDRRDVMIPMRDGVKLHAVMVVPHGGGQMPILLDRTPYSAKDATKGAGPHAADALGFTLDRDLVQHGYIVVFEDVRGKYESEGEYVMNRPLAGPLNPTTVDHSTDTWDTIDWLVQNVKEANGRVGTYGISYDGFTTLMSLVHPHPALRAAVPMNPMVDTWTGDDWFHAGAFRQEMMDYVYAQTAATKSDIDWWTPGQDDWTTYMHYGTAGAYGRAMGMEQLPFWQRLTQHPAYDAFWRDQAVDRILEGITPTVPTLLVDGQWDQEDSYGAVAVWEAQAKRDPQHLDHLVIGPWFHGQEGTDETSLGPLRFGMDTEAWFRSHVLIPFLDANLKEGAPPFVLPPVVAFQTGTEEWRSYDTWPQACAMCADKGRALYLEPGNGLGFTKPDAAAEAASGFEEYVADPAKPVPYRPRPIRPTYAKDSTWPRWLVDDQRFADGRPDVLSFTSAPLEKPLTLSGAPVAHLFASTTGTDADWVVKLIDVYPDDVPDQPELGGYELPVAMDIMRGRYRNDPGQPEAIPAGKVVDYEVRLPNVNHVVLAGHRLMVQVQSSWFPLYDRNPQSFVPNIFFAAPGDFCKATVQVFHAGNAASFLELPVVPEDDGTVMAGG